MLQSAGRQVTGRYAPVHRWRPNRPMSAKESLLQFLSREIGEEEHGGPCPVRADDGADGVPQASTFAASVFADIRQKMVSLQFRLEETQKELQLANEALSARKISSDQALSRLHDEHAGHCRRLRDEYEAAIERQQTFAREILAEKEALSKKVDELLDARDRREKETALKLERVKEDEAKREKKIREMVRAAEKARRDKIIEQMRATIKQDTIRALEPEIQRLLDANAEEKRRAAADKDEALRQRIEMDREALAQMKSDLDAQHGRALEEERRSAQERLARLTMERDLAVEEFKRKAERDREDLLRRADLERDEAKRAFEEAIRKLRRELDSALDDRNRLAKAVEAVRSEPVTATCAPVPDVSLDEKVNAIRMQAESDRDAQIRLVIDRLAVEARQAKAAAQEELREKCEELADLRRTLADREHRLTSRIEALEAQLTEAEDALATSRQTVKTLSFKLTEKEWEVAALQESVDDANGKERLARQRLEDARKENVCAMQELRERCGAKVNEVSRALDEARREKEKEMAELEQQVRQAIAGKDAAIIALRDKIRTMEADHARTDALLRSQRDEILCQLE